MAVTKVSSVTFPTETVGRTEHSWEPNATVRSAGIYTCTRTRTGSAVPKWRELVSRGENATSSMLAFWDTVESDPPMPEVQISLSGFSGAYTAKHFLRGDIGFYNNLRTFNHAPDPTLSTTQADNTAKARFYKKLQQMRTQFQGETFVGELRESLHMLRRPAAALWDKNKGYLSALSKAKRRDPKNWLKTASGLWLEQAFGWKPLLNDCKDAYQAYLSLVKPNSQERVGISGSGTYSKDRTKDGTFAGADIGTQYEIQLSRPIEITNMALGENHIVRYKGAVRRSTRATQWDNLELFGFTAENFIPTAWELLPWSFLVDYFLNIGDILNCVVTKTDDLTYVNKTTIRETFLKGSISTISGRKPNIFSASTWIILSEENATWNWSTRRREISRVANSGISLPTVSLSLNLNDGQLGNIAALLGQSNSLHTQRYRYWR